MPRDPYDILGVSRDASDDEITKAYRGLARKFHPDRNPGDKEAETKFKEIQNAYDTLSDKAKRANYDRFGSANGPTPGFGGDAGGFGFEGGGIPPEVLEQIFGQFGGMGGGFGGMPRGSRRPPPEEREHDLSIPLRTAAKGGSVDLSINGKTISVNIPAGAKDGQSLRLRGVLPGGGNLKLKLHIEAQPPFRREGDDLLVDVSISVPEAVLGAKIDVPTLDGSSVSATVPPGTSSSAKLRLRGLGINGHDLFAVLKVVVPKGVDGRGRELMEEFARLYPQKPR